MRPQSLIFSLFGNYILYRGSEIWVGSLIKLLGPFGFSEEASRAALWRMVEKGLLTTRRVGKNSFYSLSPEGSRLYAEGMPRILGRRPKEWDGQWRILTYAIPEEKRPSRDSLRRELSWLGWGQLNNSIWITPHDLLGETVTLLARLGVADYVDTFWGNYDVGRDTSALTSRCWALPSLNGDYEAFLARYERRFAQFRQRLLDQEIIDPADCFVEHNTLGEDYRQFPFRDPQLPVALQPEGWLGERAISLWLEYYALLQPLAWRFFDMVFAEEPSSSVDDQPLDRQVALFLGHSEEPEGQSLVENSRMAPGIGQDRGS